MFLGIDGGREEGEEEEEGEGEEGDGEGEEEEEEEEEGETATKYWRRNLAATVFPAPLSPEMMML